MKQIFKRELAAFLAAAAVLGGILAGATHYLTPQQHDYGSVWGMYEQEQTDSIDVLFFGSSVTYCDVVPAVYWENSGLTAFVPVSYTHLDVYKRQLLSCSYYIDECPSGFVTRSRKNF